MTCAAQCSQRRQSNLHLLCKVNRLEYAVRIYYKSAYKSAYETNFY